jgi:hypothetical protein
MELSSHLLLDLPNCPFPSGFPIKILCRPSLLRLTIQREGHM